MIEYGIKLILKDFQPMHSEFQIDNFIVGAESCPWARYKQALREIDSRWSSLVSSREDLELFDLSRSRGWPFGRRAKIRLSRRKRSRAALVKNIAETERELERFVEIAIQLKDEIGPIENGKRELLEADSWRQKAVRMSALDLLVNRGISHTTMDFILKLPIKDRQMVINVISPDANPDPLRLLGMYED